jgi:hypothetical protein
VVASGIEPGPLDPWPGTLSTRPQTRSNNDDEKKGEQKSVLEQCRICSGILFAIVDFFLQQVNMKDKES